MLAPGRGIGNKEATDGSSRDSMPEPKFEEIYITMYYNVVKNIRNWRNRNFSSHEARLKSREFVERVGRDRDD